MCIFLDTLNHVSIIFISNNSTIMGVNICYVLWLREYRYEVLVCTYFIEGPFKKYFQFVIDSMGVKSEGCIGVFTEGKGNTF